MTPLEQYMELTGVDLLSSLDVRQNVKILDNYVAATPNEELQFLTWKLKILALKYKL